MKRFLIFAIISVFFGVNMTAQDDDMYFTTSSKKQKSETKAPVRTQRNSVTTIISNSAPTIEVYNTNSRNEDEYNRRYTGMTNSEVQNNYEDVDTIYDLNDDELDYRYSRRILRFHSPTKVLVSSPYYWDLIYINGIYDYVYDPFFYDPFYWDFGWGYGCSWGPWSCWYGPIWGYRPWSYWGPVVVGPVFYGPIYVNNGGYWRTSNSLNRGTFRSANRYSRTSSGTDLRTNAITSSGVNSRGSLSRASLSSKNKDLAQDGNSSRILNRGSRENNASRSSFTRPSSSRYSADNVNRAAQRNITNAVSNSSRTTTDNRYSNNSNNSRANTNTRTQTQSRTVTTTPSRSSYTSSPSRSSFSSGTSAGGGMSRGGGSFGGGGGSRGGGRR
ncbi:MAG: hypothetical protein MJZ20_03875 [Bacteroidaceae bacterium]|nr:hypothetical protein [Bacteroidaceae bacterium]